MELRKITDKDLQGVGVVGMEDTPNLSAYEMQLKVEEVVREVVIPVINANVDNTVSKKDLSEAVFNSGAGDMQAAAYDADLDGTVNSADNGFFVYTHNGNSLTGKGDNGKFKASVSGTYSIFNVNGSDRYVKCGEESEIELIANAWYTFILDGNTINFKQGGAGLNFKIVGGTTQPASPKENTIWVNTDLEITGWAFDNTAPEYLTTGGVWIKISIGSMESFNALKKNTIKIYPVVCYQWNGVSWENKNVSIYVGNQWVDIGYSIVGVGAGDISGKWAFTTIANSDNKIATVAVDSDTNGIKFSFGDYGGGAVTPYAETKDYYSLSGCTTIDVVVGTANTGKEFSYGIEIYSKAGTKVLAQTLYSQSQGTYAGGTRTHQVDVSALNEAYKIRLVTRIGQWYGTETIHFMECSIY